MTKSRTVEVNVTQSTLVGQTAQVTADNAASQAGSADSAALIAQSMANAAKADADSNYNYANSEIAVQSNATAKAQSTADNAFSQAQAVGSQADSAIAVQSTATAKAQSTADNAFSKAQEVGSQASAEIAVQSNATAKAQSTADNAFSQAQAVGSQASADISRNSTATAKAQSTADNAFSQATTAIDNGKVTSQAVTDLKDGSKLTIADLENGLATKVANSDYASYKEQTASQIGQLVTSGAFSAYQTQTADLIAQKVATSDFSAYQATTAKAIESKVESKDFNTYKTQTADLIDDKVSNSAYASDKTQTASEIADRVSNSAFSTYQTQTASQIASKVDNGDFSTYKTQTADLIASKVANKDFSAYQATTAKAIESKVESKDFNTYKTQTADTISQTVTNAISNISIGGRNLIQNSSTPQVLIRPDQNPNYPNWVGRQVYKGLKNNETYTFSALATVETTDKSAAIWGVRIFQDNGNHQATAMNFNANTGKRQSLTFTTPDDGVSYDVWVYSGGVGVSYTPTDLKIVTTVSDYKLETGNKATDWTPAPEDQATQSQITQLSGQIDQKVSSSDFNSYKTQTDELIGQKVDNGAFKTYQNQTAELIASKVDNGTYQSDKTQTANAIASKVSSSDFKTYQTQTDKLIESKVDNGTYQSDKTQTANQIADKVSNGAFNTYKTQTDKLIAEKVSNGDFSTYKTQTADLISSKVANKDFSAYRATTAKAIESKVESKDFNTYKTQTADLIDDKVSTADYDEQIALINNNINLKVAKGDLIDEINLQAGNTLISSSGQLTLAADTIYFDTKKPVIIPSANITGTLTGKTINGSTINGTTFNAGDMISNSNNTAGYYPMTITPDGAYNSTYFDSKVALRASVQSGAILYDYRSMLPNDNGKYIYSNTLINGQGVTIESGHTDTKDSTFNAKRTGRSYISLTPSGGLMLSGPNSNIDFAGMYMNPYGNIIGKSAAAYWQISKHGKDNSGGGVTARFGIDTGDKGTINFYRPLFVDEIGGFTSSNGHALFIHGDDNGTSGSTGQMIFRKDGRSAQVVSASIYNRTYSSGSTVTVTSYGTLGRITSASKYKLDITKETSISPANKLLSIDMSSWIDKSSAELLADSKTNGTELSEPEINVNRHYGLIAEDLIKAGLGEFVIRGDKGQAEGIEYDRLWITLIPKIRQLSNENIQNKMTISRLENEIENIKQGR